MPDGITKTYGVCGGRACIEGRRIPVWIVISMEQSGATDEEISQAFDISEDQINAARAYHAKYREDIERDIRENAEAG